jgi:hypothetical protein
MASRNDLLGPPRFQFSLETFLVALTAGCGVLAVAHLVAWNSGDYSGKSTLLLLLFPLWFAMPAIVGGLLARLISPREGGWVLGAIFGIVFAGANLILAGMASLHTGWVGWLALAWPVGGIEGGIVGGLVSGSARFHKD